jgi:rubrerythrin
MKILQRLFKKNAQQKTNLNKNPESSWACSHCQRTSVGYQNNICSDCQNELAELLEKGKYPRLEKYPNWSTYFTKHTIGHVQYFPIGGTCPSCQQKTSQYFWIDRDPISVWFYLCGQCGHFWSKED